MSFREAERHYGVPRSTLLKRMQSNGAIPNAVGRPTYLSKSEEELIAGWAIKRALIACPVSKKELLDMMQTVLNKTGRETKFKNNRPSEAFFSRFKVRHNLSLRRSEAIDGGRTRVDEVFIRDWFSEFSTFLNQEKCADILTQPERIFNADEAGFQLEPNPKSIKLIAPTGMENVYLAKRTNAKRSVTVMCTISASGSSLSPYFVFPYERVPKVIPINMPEGWKFGNSKKGWMTQVCFLQFLSDHFFPSVSADSNIQFPVLLLVDGASSHISLDVAEFCKEKNIILYALPPNTSHMMQPADVSLFGPLKKIWFRETKKRFDDKHDVTLHNVAKNFEPVWKSVSSDSIISGFRACGIYPFNPDAVDYSKCVPTRIDIVEQFDKKINEVRGTSTPTILETDNIEKEECREGNPVAPVVAIEPQLPAIAAVEAYKGFSNEFMSTLGKLHFEAHIPQSLLLELKNAQEKCGEWNGDVEHTSLFRYYSSFFPPKTFSPLALDPLDELAKAIPPLPNPIAKEHRKRTRVSAITSKESIALLKERKGKNRLGAASDNVEQDNFVPSDEFDPTREHNEIPSGATQDEPLMKTSSTRPNCKKRGRPKKIRNVDENHASFAKAVDSSPLERPKSIRDCNGLPNVGNSCFINAAFQLLLSFSQFLEDLSSALPPSSASEDFSSTLTLIAEIYGMDDMEMFKIHSEHLMSALVRTLPRKWPAYRGYGIHHDAGEFLAWLIPELRKELSDCSDNPVCQNFMFETLTFHICVGCNKEFHAELNAENLFLSVICSRNQANQDTVKLENAIAEHFAAERLTPFQSCPTCLSSVVIKKGIFRFPRALVIQTLQKNYDDRTIAPIELNLSHWSANPKHRDTQNLFHLRAQVVHIGNTAENGHYVTYVRKTGFWLRYSDNAVTVVNGDYVPSKSDRPIAFLYVADGPL